MGPGGHPCPCSPASLPSGSEAHEDTWLADLGVGDTWTLTGPCPHVLVKGSGPHSTPSVPFPLSSTLEAGRQPLQGAPASRGVTPDRWTEPRPPRLESPRFWDEASWLRKQGLLLRPVGSRRPALWVQGRARPDVSPCPELPPDPVTLWSDLATESKTVSVQVCSGHHIPWTSPRGHRDTCPGGQSSVPSSGLGALDTKLQAESRVKEAAWAPEAGGGWEGPCRASHTAASLAWGLTGTQVMSPARRGLRHSCR